MNRIAITIYVDVPDGVTFSTPTPTHVETAPEPPLFEGVPTGPAGTVEISSVPSVRMHPEELCSTCKKVHPAYNPNPNPEWRCSTHHRSEVPDSGRKVVPAGHSAKKNGAFYSAFAACSEQACDQKPPRQ